jgi:hypothetical protein
MWTSASAFRFSKRTSIVGRTIPTLQFSISNERKQINRIDIFRRSRFFLDALNWKRQIICARWGAKKKAKSYGYGTVDSPPTPASHCSSPSPQIDMKFPGRARAPVNNGQWRRWAWRRAVDRAG